MLPTTKPSWVGYDYRPEQSERIVSSLLRVAAARQFTLEPSESSVTSPLNQL